MKVSTPLFQLKVRVSGKNIQEYHKDDLTFVEGKPGSQFELVIKNLSGERILCHPTVDGRSVMNGKQARKNDSSDGYVLNPYQETVIPGWRLNQEACAHFFFTGRGEETYGEQMGDSGENKGVIACPVWQQAARLYQENIFREVKCSGGIIDVDGSESEFLDFFGAEGADAEEMPYAKANIEQRRPIDKNSEQKIGSQTFGARELKTVNRSGKGIKRKKLKIVCRGGGEGIRPASVNNIGTGFGEQTQHNVHTVQFKPRTKEPIVVATVYYDDLNGLRARGLKIGKKKTTRHLPDPFPADKACPPPAGWRG